MVSVVGAEKTKAQSTPRAVDFLRTSPAILPAPMPMTNLEEVDKWFKQISCPKTKKVFNKNKMNKSFEEYVKENGDENRTDFETGKVYDSPYFLKKHLEYLNLKNEDIVSV